MLLVKAGHCLPAVSAVFGCLVIVKRFCSGSRPPVATPCGRQSEHRRIIGKVKRNAEEALELAQQEGDPLLVLLGHWHLGFILFGSGAFRAAYEHIEEIIASYNPECHHEELVLLRGSDAGVSAIAYAACCLWCLGYPEQALRRSREALALVRAQRHDFTTADVVCFAGCLLDAMRRDAPALKEHGEELTRLSQEIGFITWLGVGTCYWGQALTQSGQVEEGIALVREGMAIRQSRVTRCHMSGILGGLAEAQAMAGNVEEGLATLTEALAFVNETGERCYEAELHRLQAELLVEQGRESEAEASLRKAIEVARGQEAKSWELRAALGLARLWQRQGKGEEAERLLRPIYDWFRGGFETPDLEAARALLAGGS